LAVLGGVLALPSGVLTSVFAWILFPSTWNRDTGTCLHGLLPGIVTVVVAGLLLWFAWHMLVRNRATGGAASFLRGFSLTLAVYLLVPWPCSVTSIGFNTAISCAR
jgi:high-affinity Fe2+/Pb2+ permease